MKTAVEGCVAKLVRHRDPSTEQRPQLIIIHRRMQIPARDTHIRVASRIADMRTRKLPVLNATMETE